MALFSIILRRSAFRAIAARNLILPGASVPCQLRGFCSSPSLSSKKPAVDTSLVNDLISQVQSLQRDIELLRKSYGQTVSTVMVEQDESVPGIDEAESESESVYKGVEDDEDEDSDCIEDEEDSQSIESDVDSKDEDDDKDSQSNVDSEDVSDDDSNDQDKFFQGDTSDDDDSNQKSSSESETDDNCECNSENNENLSKDDDESPPEINGNEQLLKGIESEILRAKNFMELSAPDATIPDNFPFTIKKDSYMDSSIVLSQEYEGELIEVTVENPTVLSYRDTNKLDTNDYNEKKCSSFSMNLKVVISDLNSKLKKVEFNCGARSQDISIYSAKDPADGTYNKGVCMSEFSKNLKEEFGKYLEARGITESTTSFIYKYMLNKANKERLRVLESIHNIVA